MTETEKIHELFLILKADTTHDMYTIACQLEAAVQDQLFKLRRDRRLLQDALAERNARLKRWEANLSRLAGVGGILAAAAIVWGSWT